MSVINDHQASGLALLHQDFSVEMTARDLPELPAAAAVLPARTRINVTYLAGETMEARIGASVQAAQLRLVPVPHISARRLSSRADLDQFLGALQAGGASSNVFAVAGDPPTPEGPFEDSLALIRSGAFERYGVADVAVSGYPEGHPEIDDAVLWRALADKHAALAASGFAGSVITQFAFDAEAVLAWIAQVRERGIELPVRVGVPGPAGVKRLLGYAKRFGVGSSAAVARKYGLSLTSLMSTAGPDRFLNALAQRYDPAEHGVVQLHYYTFGGLAATANWVNDFIASGPASALALAGRPGETR